MLILPVLTFAVPAWCYIPKSVFKHLQIVQNKALRIIHNSDWYTRNVQIHEDLQMEYLKVISTKLVKNFYRKIHDSNNSFIRGLGQYNPSSFIIHKTPKSFIE